jgi:hypothetical protein
VRVRRSWCGNEDSDPPSLDDSSLAYRPPPHGAGRVPAVGSASSLTTGNAAIRRSAEQFFSTTGGRYLLFCISWGFQIAKLFQIQHRVYVL